VLTPYKSILFASSIGFDVDCGNYTLSQYHLSLSPSMVRGILFLARFTILIVVLVLVHEACSANDSCHHYPSSSYGNIQNIRYPFRLNGVRDISSNENSTRDMIKLNK
jgi:hypothetical protein